MSKRTFIKFAANHWLNGKRVALYTVDDPAGVLAAVETPGSRRIGQALLRREMFEDGPLNMSAHAQLIERLTNDRIQY